MPMFNTTSLHGFVCFINNKYVFFFFFFEKQIINMLIHRSVYYLFNDKDSIIYLEHLSDIASTIDSVNARKSLRIIWRKIRRENAIRRASSSQILASCTTTRDHG